MRPINKGAVQYLPNKIKKSMNRRQQLGLLENFERSTF